MGRSSASFLVFAIDDDDDDIVVAEDEEDDVYDDEYDDEYDDDDGRGEERYIANVERNAIIDTIIAR